MNLDLIIFKAINGLAKRYFFLDKLAIFFANWSGYFLLLPLIFLSIKNFKKYKKVVIGSLIAGTISRFLLAEIIRHFYFRPRPFVENQVNLLIEHSPSASFPSGHASFYFAIATMLYFINKKLGVFGFFISILMGISRIYCGLHWPSDVLAGAFLGILTSFFIFKFFLSKR